MDIRSLFLVWTTDATRDHLREIVIHIARNESPFNIPCAVTLDAFHQPFIFLWGPTALDHIGSHLGEPPLPAVLVSPVGDMFCDSVPLGGVWIFGILYTKEMKSVKAAKRWTR
jgi:hypothetical protein